MPDTETPAIQVLLAKGRERGKVTYAELNEALPEDMTVDQIEAVIAMLTEAHILIVEKMRR